MSEVAQSTQQEFWRPPSHRLEQETLVRESAPAMAESCPRCGSEYLLGSRFCHSCGGRRPEVMSSSAQADAAALAGLWQRGVHRIHAAKTLVDWQAIQFYRVEWLLAATASFVVGILLKKSPGKDRD